ncbi:AAA family ATPase [Nocardia sp. NPDC004860]|uniref:helix-turn-helix transcriptional regulator n=1 Tax=Nocardia sp. NPDC004860 TaxID=3154557 RepID=UPI0033B79821
MTDSTAGVAEALRRSADRYRSYFQMRDTRQRGRHVQADEPTSSHRHQGQLIHDVPLLERDSEIEAIEAAIDRGRDTDGRLLIVEGPSGIGKSRLLGAAQGIASRKEVEVLTTYGGELEREYPFGLVRRLLEARVARATETERCSLFQGHAALAESLLEPSAAPGESPLTDEFHLIHSLYWLVANLADHADLVLIADDLQWADELSLRFLLYLAQRLAELPITIIGAIRTGDPASETELVERLLLQADRNLRPTELSVDGAKRLFTALLPYAIEDAEVVAESWTATRGNPFLLGQVASSLAAVGDEGRQDLTRHISDLAPESVGRSVMLRLGGLGGGAVTLARAVSILGTSTPLINAAELAELDFASASAAADKLRAAQIFSGGQDLTFYHPIIRSAVYNRYPTNERAEAHLRAAELIRAGGGESDHVAMHLMRGAPTNADWARSALHDAARDAGRKGAPATAAGYLRRALLIPRPDRQQNARLLVDLGLMEAAAGERTALAHLEAALDLIEEPAERDRAMYALGQTLFRYGRSAEARTVFRRGADAFADNPEVSLRFEAGFMASAAYLVDRASEAHQRVTKLTASFLDSPDLSLSERLLVLHLGVFRAMCSPGSQEHGKLLLRALGDGVELWRATSDGMTMSHAMLALTWCGFGQEASDLGERLLVEARSRGDSLIFAEVSLARSLAMYSLGRVGDAMVDAQAAIVGMGRGWNSTVPAPQGVLAYCLIDRDELDEAAAVLNDAHDRLRSGETRTLNVWFYMARGRLRLAHSDYRGALDDFLLVGSLLQANTFVNPGYMLLPWRSHAGLAAHALGQTGHARTLIDRDIELSREFGLRSTLGACLRIRAIVADGGPDMALLEESAHVLEHPRASTLELAYTLCELGAAQRRSGQRVRSREPLRKGLDLAHQCGAVALERRAHEELLASGARPRRSVLQGVNALTPSEHRIASLMAKGISTRNIAESLYLTMSTVEWHRRNIYRKLEVATREGLRDAMAEYSD